MPAESPHRQAEAPMPSEQSAKRPSRQHKVGARAIHRENELGSLEVGKLADIVIVETKSVNMNPIYDPYSALVYSANASNVDTVIVNGKMIVEDKQIKTVDSKKVIKDITDFKEKVQKVAETL